MSSLLKKVYIYLENGTYLEAKSFGADTTVVGEIVFNTSLTGYQEIMSDPSYAGQFVTFTMPEIGNVGVNAQDMESKGAHAKGMIVRKYQERYSNFRAEQSLAAFLAQHNVMGICEIDTRYLTKMIRDEGAMMMIASTKISNKEELKQLLSDAPRIEDVNYIEEVSTKKAYKHTQSTYNKMSGFEFDDAPEIKANVAVIDFGVKRNILNEIVSAGIGVNVIPNDFKAEDLITQYKSKTIDGVFLSNGPGDPLVLKKEQEQIKILIDAKIPIFAICLGHQLLSISHGYDTFKLKFGHHGGNHPVKNEKTGLVEITAQNHNYNVPDNIIEIAEVTHTNLFDNTIEGLKYKNEPIFSVQHHPEASPGPKESAYIFSEFLTLMLDARVS
ncbi:glutamine-hydrolyzing carbamoyl-phosphate synthase small subunit [Sulfurimonas sp. SAG-AH-194-C21]|nr:glutamine-hydrolyzing carbamoyl-phosphate synthase small subunit [Sulfurimonas sp. SAG-AH-194-C21]MDF1882949.1 glutamine-hydrolyzing carbamoyl-phosphate synthase small subunit [Sulfurimonas sp. SAG-AH-194-C21]